MPESPPSRVLGPSRAASSPTPNHRRCRTRRLDPTTAGFADFESKGLQSRFGLPLTHRPLVSRLRAARQDGAEQCVPYRRSINEEHPTCCESLRGLFEAMSWQQMIASKPGRELVERAKLEATRSRQVTSSETVSRIWTNKLSLRDTPAVKTRSMTESCSSDPASRQRPSGVRTPAQLSRTCW